MTCSCHIIPGDILRRLAGDQDFTERQRQSFANTAAIDAEFRKLRLQVNQFSRVAGFLTPLPSSVAAAPSITVYDCQHGSSLPGIPVTSPQSASDQTIKRTYRETARLAEFYQTVFGRNSVDGAGMTLMSSVHYGAGYSNAFWNGAQMTYGDGDGKIFVDFTKGADVIAHELTHGVTQYSLQLAYTNEAGGLNEHLSDCFGVMFQHWKDDKTADKAEWRMGKDIMGPEALSKGFTCLRDLSDPAAAHCLAPQPQHFSQYKTGMDPHYSSGIPNFAFYHACKARGGRSWEAVGQVWYKAMTGFVPNRNMKMKAFAKRTRQLGASMFAGDGATAAAVDLGWKKVGL